MSRQVQNALVVVAVLLTSPIWVGLLWSMLTPFGPAEAVTLGVVVMLVGVFVVSRVRRRRASALAEDGQRPGGAVDV